MLRNSTRKDLTIMHAMLIIVTAQHSTAQHSTAQHSTAQHSTAITVHICHVLKSNTVNYRSDGFILMG